MKAGLHLRCQGQLALHPLVSVLEIALQPAQRQVRLDPSDDFLQLEGLGDVVDPAGREGAHLVLDVVQRADEENRDVCGLGIGLQLLADLEAVHLGHADVQQDQVGRGQFDRSQGAWAAGHRAHAVAVLAEDLRQQAQIGGAVVDQKDVLWGRGGITLQAWL